MSGTNHPSAWLGLLSLIALSNLVNSWFWRGPRRQRSLRPLEKRRKRKSETSKKQLGLTSERNLIRRWKRVIQTIRSLDASAPEIERLQEGVVPGRAEIHGAARSVLARYAGQSSIERAALAKVF